MTLTISDVISSTMHIPRAGAVASTENNPLTARASYGMVFTFIRDRVSKNDNSDYTIWFRRVKSQQWLIARCDVHPVNGGIV